MREVCHARNLLSLSTLKALCYPTHDDLSYVESIQWGGNHEKDARPEYIRAQEGTHLRFELQQCGLIIDEEDPYIAASPDGLVHCECCGKGVAEFKCPFTLKDGRDISSLPYFDDQGLKRDHEYYYQIQTQMMVTKASYGHFCVWTSTALRIERVLPDEVLFKEMKRICSPVFSKVIIPELLARKFTSNPSLLQLAKKPKDISISR